jgi:hypothetical protein
MRTLETVKYSALSYCWGPRDSAEDHHVLIRNEQVPDMDPHAYQSTPLVRLRRIVRKFASIARIRITKNLYHALQHLRGTSDQLLWIDQLCINQVNAAEKMDQIKKMSQIYSQAHCVLVWLGLSTPETSTAMSLIRAFSSTESLLRWSKETQKEVMDRWAALHCLMTSSWFSRRWVVQELSFAKRAVMQSGRDQVSWEDLADAIEMCSSFYPTRGKNQPTKAYTLKNPLDGNSFNAKILVTTYQKIFRRRDDKTVLQASLSLESLVSSLSTFETSDPRDVIFSLLAISREGYGKDTTNLDAKDGPLQPQYEKRADTVYVEFACWVFFTTKSLDLMCRPWAPFRSPALPSWIQFFDNTSWKSRSLRLKSFAGDPGQRTYDAACGTVFNPKYDSSSMQRTHCLTASGIIIDRVTWMSEPVSHGIITSDMLQAIGYNPGDPSDSVQSKIWRILVADRGLDNQNPPGYYHRAFTWCIQNSAMHHLHIDILLATAPDFVHGFLERVAAVTEGRRFIRSKKGYVGLASNADIGHYLFSDKVELIICVLHGCSVPVILSRGEDGNDKDGRPYYRFVSEAFVYGQMDGERVMDDGEKVEFQIL